MKGRYSLPLLFIVIVTLASCGVKEDLYRDINFESDSISFNIPITTNKRDTLTLATITSSKNLDSVIGVNTNKHFNISNLQSATLLGFKIKLYSKDTLTNNLSTFSYLNVSFPNQRPFGATDNNSLSSSLSIPIFGGSSDITDQLKTGKMTYILKGAADTTTTVILKCKAVAQYRLKIISPTR